MAIYEQFDKATRRVGANVILRDGKVTGRVVLAYPVDGAGRLYAYVQVWGAHMVRAFARGGGYDKGTAAVCHAIQRLEPEKGEYSSRPETVSMISAWRAAVASDGGYSWKHQFEAAGFEVAQAC